MSVRFNGKGTRLLCLERRHPPIINDVPFKEKQEDNGGGKLCLLASDYTNDCTLNRIGMRFISHEYIKSDKIVLF